MASYGGLEGILTGPTKSSDHPSGFLWMNKHRFLHVFLVGDHKLESANAVLQLQEFSNRSCTPRCIL